MNLRPDHNRAIDRLLVATVEKVSRPTHSRSPSIVALDGTADLRDIHDPLGGNRQDAISLRFDSQALATFVVGHRYLFALAGDVCVGYFDVDEPGEVALPGQAPRSIEEVARASLHHTIGQLIGETQ